ncbi:MAG TPA: DUF1275 family protein [Roseomonas sp.]|jgi:uncharacterized membrane protein YoaK (UPF0700 family)
MNETRLSSLLSANAGYVDTAGFLALHGLFTAHVTGNFVTLGAALAFGASGIAAKLLALPVFCLVIALVRLAGAALASRGGPVLPALLGTKVLLLALGGLLAVVFGRFPEGDGWPGILTGMVLVAAMAVQNGVHRIHLGTMPPTTLMTGSTTQIVIDAVDLLRGLPGDKAAATRARIRKLGNSVLSFAAGCAAAALLFYLIGNWCFLLPPLIGAAAARIAIADQPAAP